MGGIDWPTLNKIYPVWYYQQSGNGKAVRIRRKSNIKYQERRDKPTRGTISKLSKKSLSRLAFAAQVLSERFFSMLTLTFCEVARDGQSVKRALKAILAYLGKRFKDLEYLWFMEFQKRGSPHFHILLNQNVSRETHQLIAVKWCDIQELTEEKWVKAYKVTNHPKSWEQLRSRDGAAGYVTKYATKTHQKEVPKQYRDVGRFWGITQGLVERKMGQPIETDDSEMKALMHDKRPDLEQWQFYPKHIAIFDKKSPDR